MTNDPHDVPGVIVFPPLVPLFVLVAGIILNAYRPLGLLAQISSLVRVIVGIIAFVAGLGMVIAATKIFRNIGTNVRPSEPTLALATTGVFKWTRNPMYFGGSIVLLGLAVGFSLDWVLLLLLLSIPLVHYGIILREERYLERRFGEEYRRYKKRVPRYCWRF